MTEQRDFRGWLSASWTHRLALYATVVLTLSLVVQIIAISCQEGL